MGWKATEAEVDAVIAKYDADGNGSTDVDEFVTMMKGLEEDPVVSAAIRAAKGT